MERLEMDIPATIARLRNAGHEAHDHYENDQTARRLLAICVRNNVEAVYLPRKEETENGQ